MSSNAIALLLVYLITIAPYGIAAGKLKRTIKHTEGLLRYPPGFVTGMFRLKCF